MAEIVTTGTCDGVGQEVLQEVKDVLFLLQIVGEFESSSGEEVEVEEYDNTYGEVDHSREGGVIQIKTEEFIIKLEPQDDPNDNNWNGNLSEDKPYRVQKSHASRRSSRNTT